ncbi:MAG: MXAN_5187 C-terminal domain-containing protein [bacterium]
MLSNTNNTGIDPNNIDAQLSLLEARIRDLKFDYDRYFTKDLKLEPVRKREDVERLILKLSKMNFVKASQRFTYENIISRYIALKTYWDKRLRTLETLSSKKPVETVSEKVESDRYQQVYNDYVKLVTALNPSAKLVTYDNIKSTLDSKRSELIAQYKCKDVEFKVEIENKKLKFKAIPKY